MGFLPLLKDFVPESLGQIGFDPSLSVFVQRKRPIPLSWIALLISFILLEIPNQTRVHRPQPLTTV